MNEKSSSTQHNRQLEAASSIHAREDREQEAAGIVLGRRVTELRQRQKLSQRELDRLGDFGHGWVSALESGQLKNPGIDSISRLATALGVTVTRLLSDEPASAAPFPGAVGTSGETSAGANQHLQELYSNILAIWQRDPGRIAALEVLVRDMHEQVQVERTLPVRKRAENP